MGSVCGFLLLLSIGAFALCFFYIHPNHPGVHITDATLTSPNTTHDRSDLSLTIKIKNRSGYYEDYNKNIKLAAFCSNNLNNPIGIGEVQPFGQDRKKSNTFTAVLPIEGEKGCGSASNNGEYDDIVVKVYISNIYYVMGPTVKGGDNWQMESEFVCNLKVPVIAGGATPKNFTDTKCKSSFELYH